MKRSDGLLNAIKEGMSGLNVGLSTGLEKLDDIISGVQRSTIYNVAGGLASGKTSFAIYAFIYQTLKTQINNPNFHIVFYSLEITAQTLLAKLLCLRLYEVYGVEIKYSNLFSRNKKSPLTAEQYSLVEKELDWLYQVETHMQIWDKSVNAEIFEKVLLSTAKRFGTFVETSEKLHYEADSKELFILVFLDHVGLIRKGFGQSKKEAIDDVVEKAVTFRNTCGFSFIFLQQINRTGSSMDRRKADLQEIELQDLKDTGGVSEAADVVLAIFFPHREKMSTYRHYKINQGFRDAFRSILVLKNRYDSPDFVIPINFFGSLGLFVELPDASTFDSEYDYTKHLHLIPPVPTEMSKEEDNTNSLLDFHF